MKLKTIKRVGTVGEDQREDWSTTKKEFTTIELAASGRGWSSMQIIAFVDDHPDFIEVELINKIDDKTALVILKSHRDAKTCIWTKKPYVRKTDRMSGPNVNLGNNNVKPLAAQYAVQSFSPLVSEEMIRESYEGMSSEWCKRHNISFEQFKQPIMQVKISDLVD